MLLKRASFDVLGTAVAFAADKVEATCTPSSGRFEGALALTFWALQLLSQPIRLRQRAGKVQVGSALAFLSVSSASGTSCESVGAGKDKQKLQLAICIAEPDCHRIFILFYLIGVLSIGLGVSLLSLYAADIVFLSTGPYRQT